MEEQLETIDLDIDEANELLFKVQIQGAGPAGAKVRMVCESSDVGFVFNGKAGPDGLVAFNLPVMKDKANEGVYQARVEVVVENRYFSPVQFQVNFKRPVKVVAEVASVTPRKVQAGIQVTATSIARKPSEQPSVQPQVSPAPFAETLKERFQKKSPGVMDEDAILDAAQLFVKNRRTR